MPQTNSGPAPFLGASCLCAITIAIVAQEAPPESMARWRGDDNWKGEPWGLARRGDRDDEAEGYHYSKSRSQSRSRVAPGSAKAPMTPPVTYLPRHGNQTRAAPGSARDGRDDESEGYRNAKSRSRSQSRAAPGPARVSSQTSSHDERRAMAAAQREGGDKHRLWLDRKYRKRAWKRHARDHQADPHYPDDLMQCDWYELLERALDP